MRPIWVITLFVLLFAARLCHRDLVWVEEGYPTAAAIQMLDGKTLYRDIWFDKPPLFPAVYTLWGARTGVALRLGGALFALACCWMLGRFGGELFGEREGTVAAGLLAFFLIFGIPSAVLALAPDLLMILPHVAAIYLAWRGRAFWCGVVGGCGMLLNTKAVFILAACALWQWRSAVPMLAGFAIPNVLSLAWMGATGALNGYLEQVWSWGWLYSRAAFLDRPVAEATLRTLNWTGFHAAIVVGGVWTVVRRKLWHFGLWILIALAGVAAGWRFFPRYYFLLLPPFCLLAAKAWVEVRWVRYAMIALLLVPAVRFGPRYVQVARGEPWADTAMMEDSRSVAALIAGVRKPGDTLLVWGYRPDVFAFTRMPAGTRFLDSQPLTGVIADRHLTRSDVAAPELAVANRRELVRTAPTFIVDGLGPYNPSLAITSYTDLHPWIEQYRVAGATRGSILYERRR